MIWIPSITMNPRALLSKQWHHLMGPIRCLSENGRRFSGFCFGAAISVEIAKVVAYGIACNSCRLCTEYQSKKRLQIISGEDLHARKFSHEPLVQTCTVSMPPFTRSLHSRVCTLDRVIVFT